MRVGEGQPLAEGQIRPILIGVKKALAAVIWILTAPVFCGKLVVENFSK